MAITRVGGVPHTAAYNRGSLPYDQGGRMDMLVYYEADIRDDSGRWVDHCHAAAVQSAEEAVAEGIRVAQMIAPRKTGHMAATIRAQQTYEYEVANTLHVTSAFSVGSDHWHFQEYGTLPHDITGMVSFYWEKQHRRWQPGTNVISHPGNRATHFMVRGNEAARDALEHAVRRNYPH